MQLEERSEKECWYTSMAGNTFLRRQHVALWSGLILHRDVHQRQLDACQFTVFGRYQALPGRLSIL
jgi:hypothetical protein